MRHAKMLWGNVRQHRPVTISPSSSQLGSIGADQVLTINPVNIASGITYYLHDEVDAVTGYESVYPYPAENPEDVDVMVVNSSEGEKLIDVYITASGNPTTTIIPSGAWKFTTFAKVGTVVGVTSIVIRVYKRTVSNVETELFNTSFVIDSAVTKQFDQISVQQEINLAVTDRLVFKYFVKTTSVANRTVTMYYEGTEHYSHIDTPLVSLPAPAQIQSDWNQATNTALDYIKNKPTFGTISSKNYWSGTLAAYTALGTYDANTIYFIEE